MVKLKTIRTLKKEQRGRNQKQNERIEKHNIHKLELKG
jgi:hypothetical protein